MVHLDFYNAAVTVLPLLFITLVVEQRAYDRDPGMLVTRGPFIPLSAYLTTLLVAVVGESVAFYVLLQGSGNKFTAWLVANALLLIGMLVVKTPLWPMVIRYTKDTPKRSIYVLIAYSVVEILSTAALLGTAYLMLR